MIEINKLNFSKLNGLMPAVILDDSTGKVLMLGFMNEESLSITLSGGEVTFFSRSKNRLWKKGETSGNVLKVKKIVSDCDKDSLLIYAVPKGPTCHTGAYSCFESEEKNNILFLEYLFKLIKQRKIDLPEGSYTTKLFKEGENRIIQKVGEEAVETVIAAKNNDRKEIINEISDLFYHLLVLLNQKSIELTEITKNLENRHIAHPKSDIISM